ncbi:hypothetical protein PENTCL1PPCAC_2320 [Pristionchus entomophagus]|uniref:BACK domain-containing protein n=1 Tax=Pristionchus entomophagus TaxID=358040 RepID=A0AAV5SJ10_9BILA|nr:hypothetical protein PENTCL1PPCAC_2320 [Pristionchus entomophagus]
MGNNNSRVRRAQSLSDLPRSTPSSIRARLSRFAHSSNKRLAKFNFKRKDSSKSQTKAFVDVLSHWKLHHVEALFKEFEASKILLELSYRADRARPQLPSIGNELLASVHKDFTVKFKEHSFEVHSFLARVRLVLLPPSSDGIVTIDSLLPPLVNISHIEKFFHWLYTDEWTGEEAVLSQLRSCLGSVYSLEEDLIRAEHLASQYGDMEIILVRDAGEAIESTTALSEARIRLDSCLVASRSSVLSRLIKKKEDSNERCPLVLDESLLPRAFLPVITHFLYTDKLDLNLVSSSRAICTSSLSEARAIISGHSPHSYLHRAAHLVHIARFLSLNRLAQLCEDVLLSELSLSTAVPLLLWSMDGGSNWLARLAKATILKDFSRFVHSSDLFSLSSSIMEDLLSSQFVQATEVDILEGVLRWGEHELLKRLEASEPNVVADTFHSVSRRGVKRSEMDSRQLRLIVCPLSSHIRVDYCLPPFHQSVEWAYQAGILERGSLRDLVVCPSTAEIDPDLHWHSIPHNAQGPRLYLPYYQVVSDLLSPSKDSSNLPSTSESPPEGQSILDSIIIENGLPHLITHQHFQTISSRLRDEVEKDDRRYNLMELPRLYHRRTALQLISSRVIRELDVMEEGVRVFIRGSSPFVSPSDSSSEEGPPPDLLPHPSSLI